MKKILLYPCLCIIATIGGCKSDEPCECDNPQELITTLKLTLTEQPTSSDVRVFTFSDPDGDGGNAPTITNATLKPNTTYIGTISVLDESKTPIDDITLEIEEEKNDHQFFYTVAPALNINIDYNDIDDNGLPIGINTSIATGTASNGILTVTLKHQPGIKNNNISAGETDIKVDFTATIQ